MLTCAHIVKARHRLQRRAPHRLSAAASRSSFESARRVVRFRTDEEGRSSRRESCARRIVPPAMEQHLLAAFRDWKRDE